ncbi:MAG: PilZ domain-containing protein [Phycisphaerales bacterium]|nr:PilZ domain-containing protein [Phycisphaerales bacterium]
MTPGRERRRFPRYVLPSMYTNVVVRRTDEEVFGPCGHAYDVSVGGMRFELDEPLKVGDNIVVRIELPGGESAESEPVFASGRVVWLEEEDLEDAGPVRMACVFHEFARPEDQDRLVQRLSSGRFSLAA